MRAVLTKRADARAGALSRASEALQGGFIAGNAEEIARCAQGGTASFSPRRLWRMMRATLRKELKLVAPKAAPLRLARRDAFCRGSHPSSLNNGLTEVENRNI